MSSIVLDPNNDLARLGDAWPEEPPGWAPEDVVRSKRYLTNTDVVVWTPRRETGRPLTFQPLPDFQSIMDYPHEFSAAIDAAVALAGATRQGGRPHEQGDVGPGRPQGGTQVVRPGWRIDLRGYIDVLRALPDGVSQLDKAEKIANEMPGFP